jgi:hypothetical protein
VYLAEDQTSGRLFALKKIRCPLGSESVKAALKEVEGTLSSLSPPLEQNELTKDVYKQPTSVSDTPTSFAALTVLWCKIRRERARSFTCVYSSLSPLSLLVAPMLTFR